MMDITFLMIFSRTFGRRLAGVLGISLAWAEWYILLLLVSLWARDVQTMSWWLWPVGGRHYILGVWRAHCWCHLDLRYGHLECGDGGLNFLLCNMGLERPVCALKRLQWFILLVSKLLLEPVFGGFCFAFVRPSVCSRRMGADLLHRLRWFDLPERLPLALQLPSTRKYIFIKIISNFRCRVRYILMLIFTLDVPELSPEY